MPTKRTPRSVRAWAWVYDNEIKLHRIYRTKKSANEMDFSRPAGTVTIPVLITPIQKKRGK